jgi:segregation and condensation protein B
VTEHHPTQLDTPDTTAAPGTPDTDHPSFVDNGADAPTPTPEPDAAETAPQTGLGSIPTESGEDNPPESGSEPPQTGLGDEPGEAEATSAVGESRAVADGVPEDEDHLEPGQTEVPVGDEVVIDDETMRRALEAILMVTDEPLPVLTLARAVGRPTGDVATALGTLAAEYTEQGRGFDLREVGGGWRYYTRVEAAPYVERFVLDGQQARITQAALETLAVVAYKQPVSRARVSAIRGVNVDGVMRTLIARGLVEEAGADTESQATLYRTTSYFLERMGMQSLDDLPELAPYLPDMDDIEEELAAQTLPPASPEEAAPEEPTAQVTPSDPTDEAESEGEPDEAQDEAAEAEDEPVAAYDEAVEPEGEADEDTGIDGDLSSGEPVELDVAREPGDLEPAEEVEPADEPELSHSGDSSRDG